jgi:hypothetical protein
MDGQAEIVVRTDHDVVLPIDDGFRSLGLVDRDEIRIKAETLGRPRVRRIAVFLGVFGVRETLALRKGP